MKDSDREKPAQMFAALQNPVTRVNFTQEFEFFHLAQRYNVRGVPLTGINESTMLTGAVPESALLQAIQKATI